MVRPRGTLSWIGYIIAASAVMCRTGALVVATGEAPLAFFKCPSCNHQESNNCKPFRHGDLDKKQQCNACSKSTPVNQWKCSCAKYWHRCRIHRHCWPAVQHSERPTRPRASTSQVCTKRPRTYGTQTFEVMRTEDENRAKRKLQQIEEWQAQPTIILGQPRIRSIRVSSLCPPLKRRFIHPGGE